LLSGIGKNSWLDLIVLTKGKTTRKMEIELKEREYTLDIAKFIGSFDSNTTNKRI